MKDSLVSVVLCTFNGERFISEQLESICKQTHANLEIIIFDDASTDGTIRILEQYASRDSRIRLSRNERNLGFNLNFNEACKVTKGEYVAISDHDDIWELNKIEVMLKRIAADPSIMLVHCRSARFEEFGKFHLKSHRYVNYEAGRDVRNFFLVNFINGHNMLLRRSVVMKALPFPPNVYYDWWLSVYASCEGRIEAVPQVLVWHRVHDANATGAAKPKQPYYLQMIGILPELMRVQGMKEEDRLFAGKLLHHFESLRNTAFSMPLFIFLLSHARMLNAHKRRNFPWFSYLKHAFKNASRKSNA